MSRQEHGCRWFTLSCLSLSGLAWTVAEPTTVSLVSHIVLHALLKIRSATAADSHSAANSPSLRSEYNKVVNRWRSFLC